MKKTQLIITSFVCLGLCTLFASSASAHFPWLNLSDYSPVKGAKIKGTIGWGHHYPLDGFLKQENIESGKIIAPGNDSSEIAFTSAMEWESGFGTATEGAYLVVAERKPGFYTKTTQGHKSTSKEGLEGVLSCSYSHMSMKAVATMGETSGDVSQPSGLPIEIVPMNNPASLKPGDYLNFRVLLDGQPFRGQVFGTYAGFSTDNGTFAYATTPDKEGYGRVRILSPGIWLLKTSYEADYPDLQKCDKEVYTTSLTFEIQ